RQRPHHVQSSFPNGRRWRRRDGFRLRFRDRRRGQRGGRLAAGGNSALVRIGQHLFPDRSTERNDRIAHDPRTGAGRRLGPIRAIQKRARPGFRQSRSMTSTILALTGLATILLVLAAILSKRLSPLVAFTVLPLGAAVVLGRGGDAGALMQQGMLAVAP